MEYQLNWLTKDNENFFASNATTLHVLASGCYKIQYDSMQGAYFAKAAEKTDELFFMTDSISIDLLNEIKKFWASQKLFQDFGFLWKQGILLYGPPGSGKTSSIELIKQDIRQHNGVIFYANYDADYTIEALESFRKRELHRPILLIQEDLDGAIESDYNKSKLLGLLDGEHQIENIVVIATTNDINRIPDTIKKRPGRFNIVKYVGAPSIVARKEYITRKYPHFDGVDKIVEDTEGFYFSHLRELMVCLLCYKNDYDETMAKLRDLITANEEEYKQPERNVKALDSSTMATACPPVYASNSKEVCED